MSQLQNIQEQAAQAERDREHWQQEYQLLLLRQEQNEVSIINALPLPYLKCTDFLFF